MIILGIDPGTLECGYGILEIKNRTITGAGCNVIRIDRELSLPLKLVEIYNEISKIADDYQPDVAAVESIFYGKNISSAFTLGHARGVILLALAEKGIQINEYSPREVKKSVVGNGNASKEQIQYMLKKILNLSSEFVSQDASDALAIALCHFNKIKFLVNVAER
ncbi:MAG: crossover junction endodeoxyribonuclease RuvC [Candidatus Cloacimonetes bacterium]|nr:crossover junction endodeoxyribonuclease RuvC [Candidatus Cloacimonadota bacterium]